MKKVTLLVLSLTLFILSGIACAFLVYIKLSIPRYKDGEIFVYFEEGVNLTSVNETIKSFGCDLIRIEQNKPYIIARVKVPSGEEEKYIILFKEKDEVKNAQRCPLK